EKVVVLAHGAVDDVLDRDHPGDGLASRDRFEHPSKTRVADALSCRPEVRDDGILGEGAGLAGVGDSRWWSTAAESTGRVPARRVRCATVRRWHWRCSRS